MLRHVHAGGWLCVFLHLPYLAPVSKPVHALHRHGCGCGATEGPVPCFPGQPVRCPGEMNGGRLLGCGQVIVEHERGGWTARNPLTPMPCSCRVSLTGMCHESPSKRTPLSRAASCTTSSQTRQWRQVSTADRGGAWLVDWGPLLPGLCCRHPRTQGHGTFSSLPPLVPCRAHGLSAHPAPCFHPPGTAPAPGLRTAPSNPDPLAEPPPPTHRHHAAGALAHPR